MKNFEFTITEKEGKIFSDVSGDLNKIHIDNLTGYNSLYGKKICHGCLLIIKTFKITKLNKYLIKLKTFEITINFRKPIEYNKKISIKLIIQKSIIINIFQNNIEICNILVSLKEKKKQTDNNSLKNIHFKKIFKFEKKNSKKDRLFYILENLSKYTGMFYPGKNSLIKSININYSFLNTNKNKKFKFYSSKIDTRLPLINNLLTHEKFIINFDTLVRPNLNIKYKKINSKILNKIMKINNNILIIGGSNGIGFDLMKLLLNNKKIKIISSYYKNKIILKNKNLIINKINIEKNFSSIKKIIKKYQPLYVYYCATPKIYPHQNNQNLNKIYNKYYIEIPKKILDLLNHKKSKLLYPSTILKDNSSYSLKKKEAEKKLKNKRVSILRIDEINTKQNLSILNNNLPNFRDYLEKNKNYQKKIFFS